MLTRMGGCYGDLEVPRTQREHRMSRSWGPTFQNELIRTLLRRLKTRKGVPGYGYCHITGDKGLIDQNAL